MDELVERDCYLLVKRGLYYRPDNCGYTGLKREAGRYPAHNARPDCGVSAIHEDEAPEYSPACWQETIIADKDRQITALEAKLAAMGKALEPFARKADKREAYAESKGWRRPEPDSHQITHRLGDFRNARTALHNLGTNRIDARVELPVGTKVIVRPHGAPESEFRAEIVGYVEGWPEVRFRVDGSTVICRPSSVSPRNLEARNDRS